MRKTMPLALLLALCACASPGANAPVAAPVSPAALALLLQAVGRMPQKDQTYAGTIVLAGRTLPLPPGDWLAIFTGVGVTGAQIGSASAELGGVAFLVQRQGQTLARALNLSASAIDHHAANSIGVAGPCASSDVLRGDIRSAAGKDAQDCVSVYFYQQAVARLAFKQAWQAVDALNLIVPPTFVGGSIRLVTPDAAIEADLITNPDAAGIAVDAEPNRVLNGWARDRLTKDAAKSAYVERLAAAMETYRAALLAALKQVKPVPAPGAQPGLPGPGGRKPVET